jgi:serine/threonine protein kinase
VKPSLLDDKNKEIERELKSVPRLWRNPLARYAKSYSAASGGFEGVRIGRKRDGSIERVRWSGREGKALLLLAEYKALQKASHEYLVSLRWVGKQNERFYVATSWLDLEPRTDWPIPIRTLLGQMECAARGVAALHKQGLVHGDLKPETILWDGDRAIVTDFKLAAPAGRREHAFYSPKFAAPEQILEESVGPEADVYALGVTLYTLFIRERFPNLVKTQETSAKSGNDVGLSAETEFSKLNEAPAHRGQGLVVGAKVLFRRRLSSVVDGVRDANLIGSVLEIVRRACELDPSKRYTDAAAMADALRELRAQS